MTSLSHITVNKYINNAWKEVDEIITPEVKYQLFWQDKIINLLAFPEKIEDLALGHALLELCKLGEGPAIKSIKENELYLKPKQYNITEKEWPNFKLTPEIILAKTKAFVELPGRWLETGCFHRAALYDPNSESFVAYVEDIGRHNCVDRIAGWGLQNEKNPSSYIFFISARATTSIIEKIHKLGALCLISLGATTTSAIQKAKDNNITLIGYSRENRFTVFTDSSNFILNQK